MIGFRCECGAAIDCTYPKCKEGVETNGKDITERLQDYARDYTTTTYHDDLIREAVTEIAELRQQLAERDEQISDLTISSDTYFAERNSARDVWRRASKDRDELRQQLVNGQRQMMMLRDALVQQNFWVEGALLCKEWQWCPDQRETAEGCLAFSKEALAATNDEFQSDIQAAAGGLSQTPL